MYTTCLQQHFLGGDAPSVHIFKVLHLHLQHQFDQTALQAYPGQPAFRVGICHLWHGSGCMLMCAKCINDLYVTQYPFDHRQSGQGVGHHATNAEVCHKMTR